MMISKVALVLSGNIETAPYYVYYTDIFDKLGIKYNIICWDRLSLGTNLKFCFHYKSPVHRNFIRKIVDFKRYSNYVKKIILPDQYDLIFVFTIMNSIFLGSYLIKNFKGKFVIDIRDYSSFYYYTRIFIKKILECSLKNYISSYGWKSWLPKDIEYTISHNVRHKDLLNATCQVNVFKGHPIVITTFGTIRDYNIQKKLISALKNKENFMLAYFGGGYEPIQSYAIKENILNIKFSGRYKKEEEAKIVSETDFVNILLPRSIQHDGIMSNRFYQAIISSKPIIVNKGNIQEDFVNRFSLVLEIDENTNIYEKLVLFKKIFNPVLFEKGCKEMTELVLEEVAKFENSLSEILLG